MALVRPPAGNIGLGAIRAEGRSTRRQSIIGQWLRGDLFQKKVSFTLVISFLYHHFRVGGHSNNSRTAPSPARWLLYFDDPKF